MTDQLGYKGELSKKEAELFERFVSLKRRSGSHSPSIAEIEDAFPEIKIKIDACYLSNPYATELFVRYMCSLPREELRKMVEYYPSQNRKMSKYISSYTGIPSENIIVGNGASEIISAFLMCQIFEGKTLLPIPTFSPYYEYASSRNKIKFLKLREEDNFSLPLEEMEGMVKSSLVDNIVVINPNNPNGGYVEYTDLRRFIGNIYDYIKYIIIDESFIHFVGEEIPPLYELFLEFPRKLILVKSMSKDFGIAGVRLGYAVCDEELVRNMLSRGFLWNVSGIGEYFLRLLAHESAFREEYENTRKRYVGEIRLFFEALSQHLKVYPSRANFILGKVPVDADLFVFLLLYRYGVYLRSASDKIGLYGNFVRIAARTSQENSVVVEKIAALMEELKGVGRF